MRTIWFLVMLVLLVVEWWVGSWFGWWLAGGRGPFGVWWGLPYLAVCCLVMAGTVCVISDRF